MDNKRIFPSNSLLPINLTSRPRHTMLDGWLPDKHAYDDCADFAHSTNVKQATMVFWRVIISFWLVINCLVTFWANPDGMMHLFYFFSYWGSIFTGLSFIFSNKAAMQKEKWQWWACFMSQLAMGANFFITPFFWVIIAPELFRKSWSGFNLVINIHLITTHSVPILGSLLNVYMTRDFVMRP